MIPRLPRLAAAILAGGLVLAPLTACGQNQQNQNQDQQNQNQDQNQQNQNQDQNQQNQNQNDQQQNQ